MITFDEALAVIVGQARPLSAERVSLTEAYRRVLAQAVVAAVDAPPADISAMDGYAVRESDLGPGGLILVGESLPGLGFAHRVGPGQCVRIFTGSPVPAGADRVIVQEIANRLGKRVAVTGAWTSRRHIRARGSDFRTGDRLFPAGHLLDARTMVAVAGADLSEIEVWRRPGIVVLSTGDELAESGMARNATGSIPESVSYGIAGMAADWGGQVTARMRAPDELAALAAAAKGALDEADLVIVTGGASVGERDHARRALASIGLDLMFAGVAIRPGKPVWFGRVGARLVLGLPGNPTSAMVTARLLMAPLIAGLAGRDPMTALRWRQASLDGALGASGDRETFVRARWTGRSAEPLSNQDTGAQHALAEADLLIRRSPGAPSAAAGEQMDVIDF